MPFAQRAATITLIIPSFHQRLGAKGDGRNILALTKG